MKTMTQYTVNLFVLIILECCNDVHCTGNEVCDPATETCVGELNLL